MKVNLLDICYSFPYSYIYTIALNLAVDLFSFGYKFGSVAVVLDTNSSST